MPKPVTVKMLVPSNSRPAALKEWLNKQLAEHRMEVTGVSDDTELKKEDQ